MRKGSRDRDKAGTMKRLGCLCFLGVVLGCAAAEPLPADRDACISAGHRPQSEAFEACLQERLARRFERAPSAEIDELRTRMGRR